MSVLDPNIVDDFNTETREKLVQRYSLGVSYDLSTPTPQPESVAEVLRSLVRLVFHPMTFSAEKRK